MSDTQLTHFTGGRAAMVDVGGKPATRRMATARGWVEVSAPLAELLRRGGLAKGDAFALAKTAAILAAKQTGHLIPLCHPLALDWVEVELALDEAGEKVEITATARATGPTGVEMEALTAVSVAALTLYDMGKSVDKAMVIGPIRLAAKEGGKSGAFVHPLEHQGR